MATAIQELLPLEGSTSAVWKHFGFPAKDGKIILEKKKRDWEYQSLTPSGSVFFITDFEEWFHLIILSL